MEIVARDRVSGSIQTAERSDRSAKRLRGEQTYWEKKLWKELRRLNIPDTHFRRQAPLGPYIVDFVCPSARLIVEVDGPVHELDAVALRDAGRDAWIAGRGYRVMRLTNRELERNPLGCLQRIISMLGARTPTPGPSPQGGGGSSG